MRITGAEFKEWHDTAWPEGYIWGEESTLADERDLYGEAGEIIIKPTEVFVVPSTWDVVMEDGPAHPKDEGHGMSIRSLIKAWRKERKFETVALTIPIAEIEYAKTFFAVKGWKIA